MLQRRTTQQSLLKVYPAPQRFVAPVGGNFRTSFGKFSAVFDMVSCRKWQKICRKMKSFLPKLSGFSTSSGRKFAGTGMYRYDESLLCGVAEAHGVEGGVGSVALQEFGVSALLDDATGLQDDDIVGSLDGRETVGDHYGGATAQETAQALLHDQFGHGIDVGCRLVEDEDARIGQQGAGEGDELALAHAQVTPAFANGRIVAVGQLQHQFVQADGAGRLLDLFVCGVQATVANVLADSAGEEELLLQHNADLAAQRTLRHVADIVSIDEDGSLLDVIETRDQAGDCAFARARWADDGDGLPRLNGEIKAAQHGQFGMVAEGDVAKLYAALDGRHLARAWPVGDFDRHAQNLEDTLRRDPGAL